MFSRRHRTLALLLACCFMGGLLSAGPAFTQEQAKAWLAEVLPAFEAVSGRQPARPPTLVCVEDEALAEVLTAEFTQYLSTLNPGNDANELMAQLDAAFLAKAMLGKYSPAQKKLLLVPENFTRIMAKVDIPTSQTEALAKLVILHELTHHLQDEAIDLGAAIAAQTDQSSLQALMAAIEGQAVLFHELAGQELGYDEAVRQLNYLLPGGGYLQEKYPNYSKQLDSSQIHQKISYNYGPAYMRKLYDEGGATATWQAIDEAPVDLDVILTARNVAFEGKDFVVRLRGVERIFDTGDWLVQNLSLDKAGMHNQFARLSPDDREAMLAAINNYTAFIAMQRRPDSHPRMLVLSVMILTEEKHQQLIQDFIESGIEATRATYEKQGIEVDSETRTIELADGVRVHETNVVISMDEQSSSDQYFGLISRGQIAVQYMITGCGKPTNEQYDAIAKRIFAD